MIFNKCNKILLIILFVIIEVIVVVLLNLSKFILLNENQLLYLSSTGAQVVASLLGLTITGYIFLESKLNEEIQEDETLIDTINSLKTLFRKYLLELGVLSFLAITLCIFNIVLGAEGTFVPRKVSDFILNNSVLLIFLSVVEIILFVWTVLDPNRNAKISDSEKAAVETGDGKQDKGDLSEFLKTYNEIESLLNKIVEKSFSQGSSDSQNVNPKQSIYFSLKMLSSIGLLPPSLLDEINALRKYRNLVVHSSQTTVTETACKNATKLLGALKVACEKIGI